MGAGKAPQQVMWVLASRLHPGNGEDGRVWVGPLMLDRKVEAHVSQGGATAEPSVLSVQGCSAHPSFTRGALGNLICFFPLWVVVTLTMECAP